MLKTLFLVLLLAGAAPAAFAQTAPTAGAAKGRQYEHCILVFESSNYEARNVRLEYGQNVKGAPEKPELVQADVAVRKLRSVVAALDYMSGLGWECISVNTLSGNAPETGYLLRRLK